MRNLFFLLLLSAGCGPGLKPVPSDFEQFGPFASRVDFLQRLEPLGNRILHGAGPDPEDFAEYWEELGRTPPLLYTAYFDLEWLREDWPFFLNGVLSRYPALLIPQIGLSMSREGVPYEDRVARGEMDGQIDLFCWGLRQLGRPAFVRIGYGFNSPSTRYRPRPYQEAWTRIVESIRVRHDLKNIATVWCYAADSPDSDFLDYYPGDQNVDWWGLDVFYPESFGAEETIRFVKEAGERGFPVMIGEAAPRGMGVEPDNRAWRRWFVPFFRFVYSHPNVKAFCYLSWYQGNTRIAGDLEVLRRYREELSREYYLHAMPEKELHWALEWEE